MRFRIATLLCFVSSFAVVWSFRGFTDDSSAKRRLERNSVAERVDYVLATSVWTNVLIGVARGEPGEREIRFEVLLIGLILDLSRTEPFHTGNATDVFVMHGSNALLHLGVSTFGELQDAVRASRLIESFKRPFIDEEHEDHDRVREFTQRCLSYDPT